MDSVWAVTYGEYDGFRVIGVFSTRELAERHCSERSYRHVRLNQWPLNPGVNDVLKTYWVSMERNGDVRECSEESTADIDASAANTFDIYTFDAPWCHHGHGWLGHYVFAKDEVSAIQIMNEKRLEMIGSGEWEEG